MLATYLVGLLICTAVISGIVLVKLYLPTEPNPERRLEGQAEWLIDRLAFDATHRPSGLIREARAAA